MGRGPAVVTGPYLPAEKQLFQLPSARLSSFSFGTPTNVAEIYRYNQADRQTRRQTDSPPAWQAELMIDIQTNTLTSQVPPRHTVLQTER